MAIHYNLKLITVRTAHFAVCLSKFAPTIYEFVNTTKLLFPAELCKLQRLNSVTCLDVDRCSLLLIVNTRLLISTFTIVIIIIILYDIRYT